MASMAPVLRSQSTEARRPAEITESLQQELINVRTGKDYNREALFSSLDDLSKAEIPDDEAAKAELSRSWKAAADLLFEAEGHTELYIDALKSALELDPGNPEIRYELEYQLRRKRIAEERLKAAELARKGGSK